MKEETLECADNPLPGSWVLLFWLAMVCAAVYWIYFHSLGAGQGALARYTDARLALMEQGGPVTDEELVALSRDPMMVEAGRAAFAKLCVECHLERGQGKTGPNLTDATWIYGGAPTDIYSTIFLGKTGKGMPEWGASLGKLKVKQIAAFVVTLKDTNVPGKAPQGDRR